MIDPLVTRKIPLMRQTIRNFVFTATIMLGWINLPAQAYLVSNQQNLWPVMSQQFTIPADPRQADVREQLDRDLRHPKYIHMLTENARPYLFYVFQETQKLHLPAELALLPMIESEYTPSGRSYAGAVGLWQLMPDTANDYGVKMNYWYDGRKSTIVSTKVALMFLSYLYQQFNHNWLLALAAYNAGPGTVINAMRYNEEHGRPTDFWALPLPQQTRAYIPKLLALAAIIEHPHTYGVHLTPVPDKPITSTVTIKQETSLTTIAKEAQTSVSTVKKLNPELKQASTPPNEKVAVVLPANKKQVFVKEAKAQKAIKKEIAANHAKKVVATNSQTKPSPQKKPIVAQANKTSLHTIIVQPGGELHKIAEQYHTTTQHLMIANHLRTSILQPGQRLIV